VAALAGLKNLNQLQNRLATGFEILLPSGLLRLA
jgi:hypothetical protein